MVKISEPFKGEWKFISEENVIILNIAFNKVIKIAFISFLDFKKYFIEKKKIKCNKFTLEESYIYHTFLNTIYMKSKHC